MITRPQGFPLTKSAISALDFVAWFGGQNDKSGFLTPWSSSTILVLQVSIYLKKKKKKKSPHFGAKSGAPLPPKNDDFRSY